MPLTRRYRRPALPERKLAALVDAANSAPGVPASGAGRIAAATSEFCFYLQHATGAPLEGLAWLLSETFEPECYGEATFLAEAADVALVEVGPRLSFTSAFSTNAVSIFRSCGLAVERVERYRRYALRGEGGSAPCAAAVGAFAAAVHDRMTEWRLRAALETFESGQAPAPVRTVPILAEGAAALERVNAEMGLSLDAADIAYVLRLFQAAGRDPTDVELFDFSQSNSEHSRHWFFRGRLVLDGVEQPRTLMDVVRGTLEAQPANSIVAFADNSSAIAGFTTPLLLPSAPLGAAPCPFALVPRLRHLLLTAETHNFPTGIAPFPGAETGTGGRLRDSHATGSGSYPIAGTTGYCVGALNIPGHPLPWEDASAPYPAGMARPLEIEVSASNGASDYGNKFGEPCVLGFTRSAALRLPDGSRREYIKPIMFTGGIGALDDACKVKGEAGVGMVIVKLGGPAYRIGMGGSAASSMMGGDNKEELDFNAVQRGDAEMEQKVNRVIRACCEAREGANPIISIHDQGAGGNCNVLKEICAPAGGRIDIRAILSGDTTLSVLELWGAEYQEADALLVRAESLPLFSALCARECVPVAYVGSVTGDGRCTVVDSAPGAAHATPVDLDLEAVLGKMPQKTFVSQRAPPCTTPFALPSGGGAAQDVAGALARVLQLLSVGSKRFLTNKVDRSVGGLVALQQCVGPLHTPLADAAVLALGHFDTVGIASSIGEAPLKGLAGAHGAMGRLSVGEAVLNLACARISALSDTKCSANWMWAAKLPGEGAALYDAAVGMADFMTALGVAVDGGKDSLSMAARTPDGEMVKAPGTLVVSLYAPCPDVRAVATPDLKGPGAGLRSSLVLVDIRAAGAPMLARLGGSALAQVYGQVGSVSEVPDCDCPALLLAAFNIVQGHLRAPGAAAGAGAAAAAPAVRLLAYHDRSEGGTLTAALEMAFAGDCGCALALEEVGAGGTGAGSSSSVGTWLPSAFAEELGMLIEVEEAGAACGSLGEAEAALAAGPGAGAAALLAQLQAAGLSARLIGVPCVDKALSLRIGSSGAIPLPSDGRMVEVRALWEATSFALEARQCARECVASELALSTSRHAPAYAMSAGCAPEATPMALLARAPAAKARVAVIRCEGCNGDREMSAALYAAGLDVWDVHISDLAEGRGPGLEAFRGAIFPGGFSFADVLDSAKGWAGVIKFNPRLSAAFTAFYERSDTFSLGVCNGAQLLALLGWVPYCGGGEEGEEGVGSSSGAIATAAQPRFTHNASGRFESRWCSVRVEPSPAVLLAGMAGSVLGVWVAHGEGRAHFPSARVLARAQAQRQLPLVYCTDAGQPTEAYPMNPNGSPGGCAAMCSADGRHLAMMPHPERAVRSWQWPWMPRDWQERMGLEAPWHTMFVNARKFLEGDSA